MQFIIKLMAAHVSEKAKARMKTGMKKLRLV